MLSQLTLKSSLLEREQKRSRFIHSQVAPEPINGTQAQKKRKNCTKGKRKLYHYT